MPLGHTLTGPYIYKIGSNYKFSKLLDLSKSNS